MKMENPVIKNGEGKGTSDPYVVMDNGSYYRCYTLEDKMWVSEFSSLSHMGSEDEKAHIVFEGDGLKEFYAPELHKIDGKWYIYAAPCTIDDANHFMAVFEAQTENPCGKYKYIGTIDGIGKKWAIDATIFEYCNKRYMIYTDCRTLFLSEMESPNRLKGKTVPLTSSEYDWEKVMSPVVEGPFVVFDKDVPCIVYSASDSQSDDYCLGLLRFSGENILDTASWHKHPKPILSKQEGMYGPGHCSFTYADDEMYCIYHANLESGTGWNGRSVFVKKAYFEEGVIVFE